MKTFLLFACLIMASPLFAQYKAVTLFTGKIKLNSIQGVRFRGGALSTRRVESFTVPPNTVGCYYSFTTGVDSASLAALNLAIHITTKAAATAATGGASLLADQLINDIQVPVGHIFINAYIFDQNNGAAFVNNPGGANCLPQGYATGVTEGKQQLNGLTPGTYFIGLQNLDPYKAAYVNVEVVALVQNTVRNQQPAYNNITQAYNQPQTYNQQQAPAYQSGWSDNSRMPLEDHIRKMEANLFSDQSLAPSYTACIENSIITQYTPDYVQTLTSQQLRQIEASFFSPCFNRLYPKSAERKQAEQYESSGVASYKTGDINSAINYFQQAVNSDNTYGYVKSRLALCYLITGNPGATALFKEALENLKSIPFKPTTKRHIESVLVNVNSAVQQYAGLQAQDIINMYQNELANYQLPVPMFQK